MPILSERPALLTQAEIIKFYGISKASARAIIRAGGLEPVILPGLKRPKYRRADVEALIESGGGVTRWTP
jgi:hypothetical protein